MSLELWRRQTRFCHSKDHRHLNCSFARTLLWILCFRSLAFWWDLKCLTVSVLFIFPPGLNVFSSPGNTKKFENMQHSLLKTPKAIFFFRLFFNVPFKLLPYAKFRLYTKCWLKLLEIGLSATKYFSKNRDSYSEIAAQLLNVNFEYKFYINQNRILWSFWAFASRLILQSIKTRILSKEKPY